MTRVDGSAEQSKRAFGWCSVAYTKRASLCVSNSGSLGTGSSPTSFLHTFGGSVSPRLAASPLLIEAPSRAAPSCKELQVLLAWRCCGPVEWSGVTQHHKYNDPASTFAGAFLETAARISVVVTTSAVPKHDIHGFRFVSDHWRRLQARLPRSARSRTEPSSRRGDTASREVQPSGM